MDFRKIALILLQLTEALAKKYRSSSEESIENLLYFRDCQHKKTTTTTTTTSAPMLLRAEAQPQCPFPKMCCSLTCGGTECNNSPFLNHPLETLQPMNPVQRQGPSPPQIMPPNIQRRKKKKYPMRIQLQPPIINRRSSFSKEKIMSLIHQDDDIRKILKDLVRVTMQKVNLVESIDARRSAEAKTEIPGDDYQFDNDDEDDYDNDLEAE